MKVVRMHNNDDEYRRCRHRHRRPTTGQCFDKEQRVCAMPNPMICRQTKRHTTPMNNQCINNIITNRLWNHNTSENKSAGSLWFISYQKQTHTVQSIFDLALCMPFTCTTGITFITNRKWQICDAIWFVYVFFFCKTWQNYFEWKLPKKCNKLPCKIITSQTNVRTKQASSIPERMPRRREGERGRERAEKLYSCNYLF